jgi:hypothetical protein
MPAPFLMMPAPFLMMPAPFLMMPALLLMMAALLLMMAALLLMMMAAAPPSDLHRMPTSPAYRQLRLEADSDGESGGR